MEQPHPADGVFGFQSTLSLFELVPPSAALVLVPLLLPLLLLLPPLLLLVPLLLPPLLLELPLPDPLLPLELPLLDPLLLPLELPLLDPLLLPLELPLLLLLPLPLISAPLGVPQPVGPSNPTPAVQKDAVEHVPLLPEVTS
jgi:hypothetical protein